MISSIQVPIRSYAVDFDMLYTPGRHSPPGFGLAGAFSGAPRDSFPQGKPSFLAFPLRGPRKTSLCRKPYFGKPCKTRAPCEVLFAKTGFFEVALRGRWLAAGQSDEVLTPQHNVKRPSFVYKSFIGFFSFILGFGAIIQPSTGEHPPPKTIQRS